MSQSRPREIAWRTRWTHCARGGAPRTGQLMTNVLRGLARNNDEDDDKDDAIRSLKSPLALGQPTYRRHSHIIMLRLARITSRAAAKAAVTTPIVSRTSTIASSTSIHKRFASGGGDYNEPTGNLFGEKVRTQSDAHEREPGQLHDSLSVQVTGLHGQVSSPFWYKPRSVQHSADAAFSSQ